MIPSMIPGMMPSLPPRIAAAARTIGAGLGGALLFAVAATAQGPATIAEADGRGKVDVNIVYYADLGCTAISSVREGAPGNIEAPQRTLIVTVTLDRTRSDCAGQPQKSEHKITIADRPDALSVDIFYVDPDGKFVRSQRPRIYREVAECADKPAATQTC